MPDENESPVALTHAVVADVKQAQAAQLESEARFQQITERIESVFWISDFKISRMVYVSPAYERIWGRSCASLYQNPQSFLDSVHPDDRARVLANLRAQQGAHQKAFELEYRILRPDGDVRWIKDRGFPVHQADGTLLHMVGVADDITDRKNIEENLKIREEIFSSIVGQAMVAIALVDGRNGRFVEFNTAAHQGLGYSREEFSAMTIADIQAEHSPEAIRKNFQTIQQEGGIAFESRHRHRNGDLCDVHVSARALHIRGQYYTAAVWEDITQRKKAEMSQIESEERLKQLIAATQDAIIMIDAHGNISLWNDAAIGILGYSEQEALGKSLHHLLAPSRFQKAFEHGFAHFQRAGSGPMMGQVLELAARRKDGTEIPVELSLSPVRLQASWHAVGILRDISERKKLQLERELMESKLRQQQKLESVGTLAGGVAHEINNPINGIMNYAQILQDWLPAGSPLLEFTGEIMHETQRVATIVRNLLTFARDEKQTHSPARIPDILEGVLSLVRTVIRHDQISLTIDVPPDLPQLKCRSQQIQQVLMNLITNARDALNARYPGYGENKIMNLQVQLLEREGRHWVRMTVEDHGTGIEAEVKERMFDPFFTTKGRDSGTGLGLSISHSIVKDHHGEITVETQPGGFTRMHVELPLDNGWSL